MTKEAPLTPAPGSPEVSELPATPPEAPRRPSSPAFVGHAMGALLRSADVQIERGDATRVLSRANEALAAIEQRRPGTIDNKLPPLADDASFSSGPPRPRIDLVLWVVLTAGLFAIVGLMLAYGLGF